MLALVYDTETQNLPLFNEPSSDPRQPHLVQLAAHLVDLDPSECHFGLFDVEQCREADRVCAMYLDEMEVGDG